MDMQDLRRLKAWQQSMELVTACYQLADTFPKRETYGLGSQIRRSAISIPSNIAEGSGRGSQKEFSRFLRIAYGSGCELETQVRIARRMHLGNESHADEIIARIEVSRKMIASLIALTSSTAPTQP